MQVRSIYHRAYLQTCRLHSLCIVQLTDIRLKVVPKVYWTKLPRLSIAATIELDDVVPMLPPKNTHMKLIKSTDWIWVHELDRIDPDLIQPYSRPLQNPAQLYLIHGTTPICLHVGKGGSCGRLCSGPPYFWTDPIKFTNAIIICQLRQSAGFDGTITLTVRTI